MRVQKEFIKNLQGRDFVLLAGLLDLAHQDGLSATQTNILQFPNADNGHCCVVTATVTTGKGTFTGIGDAAPASVNKMIAPHCIRMAETRAIARALRVATNVAMTAFEELGGDDHNDAPKQVAESRKETEDPKAALETEAKVIAKELGLSAKTLINGMTKISSGEAKRFGDLTLKQAEIFVGGLRKMRANNVKRAA